MTENRIDIAITQNPADKVLAIAEQHTEILPPSFNLDEMRRMRVRLGR